MAKESKLKRGTIKVTSNIRFPIRSWFAKIIRDPRPCLSSSFLHFLFTCLFIGKVHDGKLYGHAIFNLI